MGRARIGTLGPQMRWARSQKIEQREGKVEQRFFRKVFSPILSISIIILLLLAVCAKNMDGVEEVA